MVFGEEKTQMAIKKQERKDCFDLKFENLFIFLLDKLARYEITRCNRH